MMKNRSAPTRIAPGQQPVLPAKRWDPTFYETKHAVVFKAAADLVDLLAPVADERILDLGCGEGRLLAALLKETDAPALVGMDVSHHALVRARARLRLDRLPPMQAARLTLFQGSLADRLDRLAGFDAAAVIEVVEHLDP